jgi:rhodanese-related sulfurtransferase
LGSSARCAGSAVAAILRNRSRPVPRCGQSANPVPSKLAGFPRDTLFVTYCAGPHCNGATRGAIRLAQLGRPVKVMVGGITGWRDEGFELVSGTELSAPGA